MNSNVDKAFLFLKVLVELVALLASVVMAYSISLTLAVLWAIIVVVVYFHTIKIALDDYEA